jgi:hypothetical protein
MIGWGRYVVGCPQPGWLPDASPFRRSARLRNSWFDDGSYSSFLLQQFTLKIEDRLAADFVGTA